MANTVLSPDTPPLLSRVAHALSQTTAANHVLFAVRYSLYQKVRSSSFLPRLGFGAVPVAELVLWLLDPYLREAPSRCGPMPSLPPMKNAHHLHHFGLSASLVGQM
jgi:hypothetical protein